MQASFLLGPGDLYRAQKRRLGASSVVNWPLMTLGDAPRYLSEQRGADRRGGRRA
jgi:hypothetical protein